MASLPVSSSPTGNSQPIGPELPNGIISPTGTPSESSPASESESAIHVSKKRQADCDPESAEIVSKRPRTEDASDEKFGWEEEILDSNASTSLVESVVDMDVETPPHPTTTLVPGSDFVDDAPELIPEPATTLVALAISPEEQQQLVWDSIQNGTLEVAPPTLGPNVVHIPAFSWASSVEHGGFRYSTEIEWNVWVTSIKKTGRLSACSPSVTVRLKVERDVSTTENNGHDQWKLEWKYEMVKENPGQMPEYWDKCTETPAEKSHGDEEAEDESDTDEEAEDESTPDEPKLRTAAWLCHTAFAELLRGCPATFRIIFLNVLMPIGKTLIRATMKPSNLKFLSTKQPDLQLVQDAMEFLSVSTGAKFECDLQDDLEAGQFLVASIVTAAVKDAMNNGAFWNLTTSSTKARAYNRGIARLNYTRLPTSGQHLFKPDTGEELHLPIVVAACLALDYERISDFLHEHKELRDPCEATIRIILQWLCDSSIIKDAKIAKEASEKKKALARAANEKQRRKAVEAQLHALTAECERLSGMLTELTSQRDKNTQEVDALQAQKDLQMGSDDLDGAMETQKKINELKSKTSVIDCQITTGNLKLQITSRKSARLSGQQPVDYSRLNATGRAH